MILNFMISKMSLRPHRAAANDKKLCDNWLTTPKHSHTPQESRNPKEIF